MWLFILMLWSNSHNRAATAPVIMSVFKAGGMEERMEPASFYQKRKSFRRNPQVELPLCVCISFLSLL